MRWHRLVILLLVILVIPSANTYVAQTDNESVLLLGEDGYEIEVIAKQFSFVIVDLVLERELRSSGLDNDTARSQSVLTSRVVNLTRGASITITAYSIDVLHGLTIPKLDLSLLLLAPIDGEYQREVVQKDLPNSSTSIGAYCSEYCGANHEDMQFILVVGDGKQEGFQLFGLGIYNLLFIIIVLLVASSIVAIGVVNPFWKTD